jgi:hypothetical protein
MKALLLIIALGAVGSAATFAATRGGREDGHVQVDAMAPKVCVTRQTLCLASAARRTGDPCGCPHPLRGNVPGYVERVGGTPERPFGASRWRDQRQSDPLDGWEDALHRP